MLFPPMCMARSKTSVFVERFFNQVLVLSSKGGEDEKRPLFSLHFTQKKKKVRCD